MTTESRGASDAKVAWGRGGDAIVTSLREGAITLRSSVPSPPGSRIEGTLTGGETLRVKIHGSKRQPDGSFVLEGRPLDMTRELRQKIEAAIGIP
jgi:hypothetical protein